MDRIVLHCNYGTILYYFRDFQHQIMVWTWIQF